MVWNLHAIEQTQSLNDGRPKFDFHTGRAVLLVRAFVLAHIGAAVAPVLFPAYKQRLGMTQAQFAWLLAYAAICA
jgi:hypothetical protein